MKLSLFQFLLVFLMLSAFCLQLLYADKVRSKYLQFSNQLEPLSERPTHFAILESGYMDDLTFSKFAICGSIYIGFYRGQQTFYTVRTNDGHILWFSLTLDNQDTTEVVYRPAIFYFDGIVSSNPGSKLRLRPHAWSHACTTVDVESGHITVVINGILTHNTTISSKDFTSNMPTVFRNNLVLGVQQEKFTGSPSIERQSEASVTNVNVFSDPMNVSQMEIITTTGLWTDGDIVSWSEADWTLSSSVKEISSNTIEQTPNHPSMLKLADGFHDAHDCMNLCPRIQRGGRLPLTRSAEDAKYLSQLFYHPDSRDWFWSSFIYQTEGNFADYYTGAPMSKNMWTAGQPNGGLEQQCTMWMASNPWGSQFDVGCIYLGLKVQCLCHFDESPILIMRGLCQKSKMDTHFTLKSTNGSTVFMGLTGTSIRFLPTSTISKWTISVNLDTTMATTSAMETSFILGRQKWMIEKDSPKCHEGEPYTSQLKMSGCKTDGEFTCDDGQCVTMEERCDQIPDCRDKSDERGCEMLVTEEGYNKGVPPFTVSQTDRSIVPVQLNISIDLLKIVDMEETDHKIDFQFEITLEWKENNRIVYHNLKKDDSLNALSKDDIEKLWLPLVIYDNTDQKEMTRLGMGWEWNTPISVIREGSFTRSGLEVVDETEIFNGEENTLSMQQVYTWQFQCQFNLKDYPFDTQVGKGFLHRFPFNIAGLHNRVDNGWQRSGDSDAAAPQDEHEAEQEQQQPGTSGASSLQHHQVGADPEEQ